MSLGRVFFWGAVIGLLNLLEPLIAKNCLKLMYHTSSSVVPGPIRERVDFRLRDWAEGFKQSRTMNRNGSISKHAFRPYVGEAPTIVEIGAHIGVDTASFARLWPQGRIYAFEPVPALYRQLERNLRGHSNVHVFPYAVGDQTGDRRMFVSSGWSTGSSSVLLPSEHFKHYPRVKFGSEELVPMLRLTDWAEDHGIQEIDVLWLDAQGLEYQILADSEKLLRSVRLIYTEVNFIETYQGTILFEDLKRYLEGLGFSLKHLERADEAQGGLVS